MNLQIENLQSKLDAQTTIASCKTDIRDVETRLGNKRKEERENDKQALASINDDIKKLRDEVAKKAPQSELDRMKDKYTRNIQCYVMYSFFIEECNTVKSLKSLQ